MNYWLESRDQKLRGGVESLVSQELVPDCPRSAASCDSPRGRAVQSQVCICHVKRPSKRIFAFCVWSILQALFAFTRWQVGS